MPRVARVVIPGTPHHVTQRGIRRSTVFFNEDDRQSYLALLRDNAAKHSVDILAYCLMTNHVHLVAVPRTSDGLHRMLKPLHMQHAQRINRAYGWTGHLWQGRFFSSPLDEEYLWAAIRYVELNPVRAQMICRAETYPWSSAAAHCGLRNDPLLTKCGAWTRRITAISDWSAWLAAGDAPESLDVLRRRAVKGLPCGSPEFIEALEKAVGRDLQERPRGRSPFTGKGLRPLKRVASPF
jgi:putative transposase